MTNVPLPAARTFLSKHGYPILLLLFFAWMCVGVFPLYCYESDSMHTIAGCSVLYNQGFTVPPAYSYEYNMQPLVYYVVAGLKCVMPILSCEQIFCLLTALAAMLFVVGGIRFVHRLTGIRRELILLAFFLLPESYAVAMYPNTAILAAVPFIFGLNALMERRTVAGIAWLCLAPLFRVDILMVYPVVLPLFVWMGDKFATALKKSAVAAIVVVAIGVLCYALLRANPFESTLDGYEKWNNKIPLSFNLKAIFTFYTPVNFILLPLGLYRLFKQKSYFVASVLLVPIVLNHVVYGRMGCATKHYLYILPFVAAASSVAIVFLMKWWKGRRVWKVCIVTALALLLVGSVRFSLSNKEWRDLPESKILSRPCCTLFQEYVTSRRFSFGIGTGFTLVTADEWMLASGNAFYPFFIHQMKDKSLSQRTKAYHYLSGMKQYTLLSTGWDNMVALPLALQDIGFSLEKSQANLLLMKRGEEEVTIIRYNTEDFSETTLDGLDGVAYFLKNVVEDLLSQEKTAYFLTCSDFENYIFDQFAQGGLVTQLSDGFYLISPETTFMP